MNLRKDHCRNLPSRETREHVTTPEGGEGREHALDPPRRVLVVAPPLAPGHQTNPGAECVKERQRDDPRRRGPGNGDSASVVALGSVLSMKNDSRQRISRLSHR